MFNIVVLTGRLVADPELRHTPNDVAVTSFTIAVDRRYSRNAEERQTDFIDVVAWRSNAEFVCKYFQKGNLIGVQGSLQVRLYQDKEGNKRKAVEVVVDNVQFVESKKSRLAESGSTQFSDEKSGDDISAYSNGSSADFQAIETDDDLPF